ncbi:Mo-co oxidoreductase dimerisation domain-containing protein [Singulisphaera sp. GP187]|uniref:DUF4082 domain-containing protein n=1 Tax=Singulisphaera sp. GP187 TaxID=1882752 RepID=UPI0009287334|nr:DUF4082 domain-containing protein [Singulisphaera sp. GP187]SIO61560.1 Mo-co oxidoreductase dimerisation domain-containing protein [Singulisphaera sp. GP187]
MNRRFHRQSKMKKHHFANHPFVEVLEDKVLFAVNPIVAENQLPGNPPSEWDIAGSGDTSLQGFATDISVDQGQTVSFKINDTSSAPYQIDIYRMGYYAGLGARRVATIPSTQTLRIVQPAPLTDASTGLVDAGNWAVAATWAVPSTATSGIYFAKITRTDTGGASHIYFVVRDDGGHSDLLFQTSDTTWEAYNNWGGVSFYTGPLGQNPSRAYEISYNRPFITRTSTVGGRDFVFGEEYPMVRWLEANGYDVSYFTGVDSDRYGSEILQHHGFLSVGHDEYWSGQQRANVETARDAGVNLAFFSANEIYWKTRWDTSIDSSHTPYRTLVCYKETIAANKIDPMAGVWTGTWRDPRFRTPGDGGLSENALSGQIFVVNRGPGGETGTSMNVPQADGLLRLWRNTAVAGLAPGQTATLGDQVLGYEWDEDRDNAFRPAGLIRMSSTTQNIPQLIDDSYVNCPFGGSGANPGGVCASCGCVVKTGTATHSLTLYRASSGALVFGAGTVQWSWGLDGTHDGGSTVPDQSMRQATVNLFADMGVQPATLQSGLVYATMSTDTVGPSSVVTSPSSGSSLQVGVPITITGTAADTGGGRVGGVEVSVDGGQTWSRATGRENWSYTWTPAISGLILIESRATDDSANIGKPSASVSENVTLMPTSATGLVAEYNFDAGSGTTLTDLSGQNNNGTISNATWTTSGHTGSALAFNGTNSWVTVANSSSLNLSSAMTLEAWVKPTSITNPSPLLFREGAGNSAYSLYGAYKSVPSIYINHNITGELSAPAYQSLATNTWSHVAATYDGSTLLLYVNGVRVSQATGVTTLSSSGGALRIGGDSTFGEFFNGLIDDVRIYNRSLSMAEIQADMGTPVGGAMDSTPPTAAITSPVANASLSGTTTIVANATDFTGVAGVQFLLNGSPLGVEDVAAPFSLAWNTTSVANGTYLLSARARDMAGNFKTSSTVSVTVNNPTDLVAPTVRLMSPYANTTAGSQMVLAAFASDNVGVTQVQFLANGNPLGSALTTAPYRALATLATGTYTITAVATDAHGNQATSSSFTVTVDTTAPTVTSQSPAPNATGIATDSPIKVTFNKPILFNPNNVSVTGSNGTVTGSLIYDAPTQSLIFSQDLIPSTRYTVTLNGISDIYGNVQAPISWSFTTSSVYRASFWGGGAIPDIASATDHAAVEVGMKFTSGTAGQITGIRFYKGAANTGTHVAHLWTATGTLLATATFTGESASGWQQVLFSAPVAISANTTYVVSYFAPVGGYATTAGYFANSGFDNGDLHAPSGPTSGGNGLYLYTNSGGFPNASFQSSNYWVDPIFGLSGADTTPPSVSLVTPASNATGVAVGTTVSASFSEAVQPSTIVMTLTGPGGAVAGSFAYTTSTNTATFTPSAPLAASTTYTVNVSGAKDLANNVMAPTSWSFTTGTGSVSVSSFWSNSVIPAVASDADTSAVELGMKFTSDTAGTITGVRFYKGAANTGTHVAHLWTATGTLLATATFTGESASGWQQVLFSAPVAISANTTYVVSYFAPVGRYASNSAYFATSGVDNGTLHAPSSPASGGNGLYVYGSSGGFPTNSYNSTNYWVDVVYSGTDTTPPTVTTSTPAANATGVATTTTVSAIFSEPVQAGTIVMTLTGPGGAVAGSFAYTTGTNTATFTPSASLAAQTTYTVNVSGAKDLANNVMAPTSWSFTTGTGSVSVSSFWSNSVIPAVASDADTSAVELGMKFTSDTAGTITGVRFYKGAANTGTHVAHLWTATGTLLATATFTGESASGWQQVLFSAPVAISANTTYVVSYFAPVGRYASNSAYFATSGVDNGTLHAPSSPASGGNGLYVYGSNGGFPTNSYNSTNYWVDVVYSGTDTTPPTVTTSTPAANATGVATTTTVSAIFSEPVQAGTIVMTLTGPGGAVAGSFAYTTSTNTATFTPSAPLAAQTNYTVNVSGAKDLANNVMTSVAWTFTTATPSVWTESTPADFATGTFNGTLVADASAGGIKLASNLRDDFISSTLGPLWTTVAWGPSARSTITGGVVTVAAEEIFHNAATATDTGVEGRISFSNAYQHFGMATDLVTSIGNSWALFSTSGTTNTLFARVNVNGVMQDVNLGALPVGFHTYQIQPVATGFAFSVDGVLQTTITATLPAGTNLRLVLSDFAGASQSPLQADWTRVMGGTYISSTFDAGKTTTWLNASWTSSLPAGTSVIVQTSSSTDNVTWSPWAAVVNGGTIASPSGRYLRYRLVLTSPDSIAIPTLLGISIYRM